MEIPLMRGVMLLEDSDHVVKWRIPCYCDDNRHNWTFEIEIDKALNDVRMYVEMELASRSHDLHYNWFSDRWRDWMNRVKIAFRVICFGYVEYTTDIGFKSEEQVKNLADMLTLALEKIKESGKEYAEFDHDLLFKDDESC